MTTYAIPNTIQYSFTNMSQIIGTSEKESSLNYIDISPSSINTNNVIISEQLFCGLQPPNPSDFTYAGLVKINTIFEHLEDFHKYTPFSTSTVEMFSKKGVIPITRPGSSDNMHYFKDISGVITQDPFQNYLELVNKDNFCHISIYVKKKITIAAKHHIHAGAGFIQSSDQRIKTDIQTYDSSLALDQIKALRVTSYKKIETPLQEEIGFIAQEVHKILPNTVEKMTMYIPNIHKWISCTYDDKKHTISVDNSSLNLNYKENIQIKDNKECTYSCIVIDTEYGAVLHSTEFVTKPPSIKDKVFLYGKSVDDFMSLNKNDIFTVAVSAIQMLDQKALKHLNSAKNVFLDKKFAVLNLLRIQSKSL